MHLLDSPLWLRLVPYAFLQYYKPEDRHRVEFHELPELLRQEALAFRVDCVRCGWSGVCPIRERPRDSDYDRRRAVTGPYYYAGTCPQVVKPGCSRSSAASADLDRMVEAVRGYQAGGNSTPPPTEPKLF